MQEGALQNGLADCYEQGLVRAVGVSNYGPKQLKKVHAALLKREVPLASAQVSVQHSYPRFPCQPLARLNKLCSKTGQVPHSIIVI